jgi:hypothetical protein
MIPDEVLKSPAFRTLPDYAVRPLIALAAQYRGHNNGDLSLTWKMAQEYGITSKEHHVLALRELFGRGLSLKTRQGGKPPLGCTLYAVAWRPIDDIRNDDGSRKIDYGPTRTAANDWAKWSETSAHAPKRKRGIHLKREREANGTVSGPTEANRQDRIRTITGPSLDQNGAKSGPYPDQKHQVHGTADGPPSRSPPEGQAIPVREPSSSASASVIPSAPTQASRGTRNSEVVVPLDPDRRRQKIFELLDAGFSPLQIQKAMHSRPPPLEELEKLECAWAAQRGYHSTGRPS